MKFGLSEDRRQLIAGRLLEMADDELIVSHRNSEWTGHAPILEEDIAFANIAQDEMGHAVTWYNALSSLTGQDPDQLVFFRAPSEYRNIQLVELPKGDWAFSMLRQFLFDKWEATHLEALEQCSFQPAAEAACKIRHEEKYHLRHTRAWVRRLALGTEESKTRMQRALDLLWPYCPQLYERSPGFHLLVDESLMPNLPRLAPVWEESVRSELTEIGLRVPDYRSSLKLSRDMHTEYLPKLIEELQQVARLEPGVRW
ncbi:MAG TPA: phenylacetate-CoA oxygenase subunit PaaC [Acidobacteriota bacterium]|nr:phenylacetate-CoA oxygenase subunit PaaC [Acidobacteriota bacterium]